MPIASVAEHYENHLAPVYVWMAGGLEAAIARGNGEIDALCLTRGQGRTAFDLGAGFGMHAIPLARHGYSVIAIDSSPTLLAALRKEAQGLPVRAVEGDLLGFPRHANVPADLILCMGDTLTHLPDRQCVESLFSDIADSLQEGGQFVTTFRDYTAGRSEDKRFIPVKSDEARILTCALEYCGDHVTVHDLLHERDGAGWQLRVSTYRKLRLAPAWVCSSLHEKGFSVRLEPGPAGMVRIIATRYATGTSS